MIIVYALTLFTSAALLFLVQPMFTRMVLPLLGGTPAVWNTAMVFFQASLLAGYVYAHVTTAWLGARRQAVLHLGLMLLPFLVLPAGVPQGWMPPPAQSPIVWLLTLLLVAIGLPFFVVSTTNPLLQRWLSATGHRAAVDPYFLYAASNLGSMLALLSYPALVEPHLRLQDQSRLWATGYGLLWVLVATCVILLWRAPQAVAEKKSTGGPEINPMAVVAALKGSEGGLPARRRLRWVLLAFVPSSLMLSVTTYLSTDVAAVPLLWVIPLAIYLLTFILVFARRSVLPHEWMVRAWPVMLLVLVVALILDPSKPLWLLFTLHLAVFFLAAMVCHGELARDRPATQYLTEFYLWMSVGGMLGGVLNALIAPLIFSTILEYPLMLVVTALIAPAAPSRQDPGPDHWDPRLLDVALPLGLGGLTAGIIWGMQACGWESKGWAIAGAFGVPVLICSSFAPRSRRFGLGVGAILLAGSLYSHQDEKQVLHTARNFFGVKRVTVLKEAPSEHILYHGNTLHGSQSIEPARRHVPLTYYYPTGPIGQVFAAYGRLATEPIAVVGLGVGSLAGYGQPDQSWTFYEIDPAMERIARDPRYFTYLNDCPAHVKIVLGDARLSLAAAPSHYYGLMVMDAYSSDAIPIHLITREALRLYLDKLAPHGLLAFHISNKHLDLEPVLSRLAADAGIVSLAQDDVDISPEEDERGKMKSQWLVAARQEADLRPLAANPRWRPAALEPSVPVWTDNYSSLLHVFKWR